MEPSLPTFRLRRSNLAFMGEDKDGQNRRSRRSNLWMAAQVECGGERRSLTLRNLSSEGALVEGDHGLLPGLEVLFCKDELSVLGRVAWVDGSRAGLAFCTSIDPETVLRHVSVPKAHSKLVHKRPGFRGREIEEERALGATIWERPPPSRGR